MASLAGVCPGPPQYLRSGQLHGGAEVGNHSNLSNRAPGPCGRVGAQLAQRRVSIHGQNLLTQQALRDRLRADGLTKRSDDHRPRRAGAMQAQRGAVSCRGSWASLAERLAVSRRCVRQCQRPLEPDPG